MLWRGSASAGISRVAALKTEEVHFGSPEESGILTLSSLGSAPSHLATAVLCRAIPDDIFQMATKPECRAVCGVSVQLLRLNNKGSFCHFRIFHRTTMFVESMHSTDKHV